MIHFRHFNWKRAAAALAIPLAAVVLAGCGGGKEGGSQGGFSVQVVVALAKQQPVAERVALVGTLAANEAVEIRSQIEERVKSIHFEEGAVVAAGQLLVELDDSKLRAQLDQAVANFHLAETGLRRNQTLLENQSISKQEYDQATASFDANNAAVTLARERLADTRIMAPFSGRVGARRVSPGQIIGRTTLLTAITDASVLKAEFSLPERFISELALGQAIEVRTAAYPEETFNGSVYFIDPRVEEATRTLLVKAKVPNMDDRLKPGMFANLDLILAVRKTALVIPEIALSYRGDYAFVYIVDADMKAALRPVKTGVRLPGQVEIREGLSVGDRVITEGFQKIGPGSPVSISPKSEGIAATAPANS